MVTVANQAEMIGPCIYFGDDVYIMVIADPAKAPEVKLYKKIHIIESQKLEV